MEQANLEIKAQFQKNNGITIEEAYGHVKKWYAEGHYQEAIDGCKEIMNYLPEYEDIKQIQAQAEAKLNTTGAQSSFMDTPPIAPEKTPPTTQKEEIQAVAQDEKIISTLGYLGFLAILPLLLKKNSDYCQFHGKQALVLAIILFLYKYLSIFDFIVELDVILHFALFLEIFIIIFAMIQAYRGVKWRIPVIAKMADKLNF